MRYNSAKNYYNAATRGFFFLLRNVKASSPWMNIILLIGILLRLPTSVYGGIIFSGYKYPGLTGMDFTPLCYVN